MPTRSNAAPVVLESLQDSLGFMLNAAARIMNRHLVQRLSPYGITPSQYITLWALWECGCDLPVSQLGKRLYLDNPTMTGIIDRMERDGLLERVQDETDRRVFKVRLTNRSRALRDELKDIGSDIDMEKIAALDRGTAAQFIDFLKHITTNGNDDKTA